MDRVVTSLHVLVDDDDDDDEHHRFVDVRSS